MIKLMSIQLEKMEKRINTNTCNQDDLLESKQPRSSVPNMEIVFKNKSPLPTESDYLNTKEDEKDFISKKTNTITKSKNLDDPIQVQQVTIEGSSMRDYFICVRLKFLDLKVLENFSKQESGIKVFNQGHFYF